MPEPADLAALEPLAVRAASGDPDALSELVSGLWPVWVKLIASSRSMGSLARSEDHVRNVATSLLDKLKRRQGHSLQLFVLWRDRHPGKTFGDWIRIITKNAVRNYVTEQLGQRRPASDGPSAKRLLNEVASAGFLQELGVTPGVTAAQTARQLLEYAEMHLPVPQQRVLAAWLEGASFDEIAQRLGFTPSEVTRLQRAAVATLRRQFAPPAGPSRGS